ncbi:hypothetical protein PG991_013524 [Apiospora marii]|uniref:BTB domain-containing protein n=1 Tax=Apiospora marii TaxID=335849 RepID=A0ABR1R688_9PEZI
MSSAQNTNLSRKGDVALFKSGKYADILIICQGQKILLHRSILGSRCAWLSDIMTGLRKVSTQRETYGTKEHTDAFPVQKGKHYELKMDAYKPALLRTVLYFIYSGEIDHPDLKGRHPDYEVYSRLHQLGGYFEFEEFQKALLAKLSKNLDMRGSWYKQNPETELPNRKMDWIFRGVRVAYSGEEADQADLRKIYVDFFTQCAKNRAGNQHFYGQLEGMHPFGHDLLVAYGRSRSQR